jgi:hypothetical protein
VERAIEKAFDITGSKVSELGFYWFLNKLMGHLLFLAIIIAFVYIFLKIFNQGMKIECLKLQEEVARKTMSDEEYRNRFKNWPSY